LRRSQPPVIQPAAWQAWQGIATAWAAGNCVADVSVCVQEFAADVAAGNCFRRRFLRPIMAASNFASFLIFRPFFLLSCHFFPPLFVSFHIYYKEPYTKGHLV
jgi:hypothetical protein